jgi:hypothetical protein
MVSMSVVDKPDMIDATRDEVMLFGKEVVKSRWRRVGEEE